MSASRCVLLTLKALSAFAILPEIDYGRIDGAHQAAVRGAVQRVLGKDLSELAKRIDLAPYEMACPSRVGQVIAKMHVRGKPNEQQRLGLRQPVDGDDEFALAAVGLVLRDLGWA